MKWLIPFLFLFTEAQADSVTTGNLLPNAGDGVDWGSTSKEQTSKLQEDVEKLIRNGSGH